MQVLINDLLSFSRVGRLGTTHTEVDLDTTLDAALANLATAIEESDAEIVRPEQPLPRISRRPHAADDVVAEPDWQCGEVPAQVSRPASSSTANRVPVIATANGR